MAIKKNQPYCGPTGLSIRSILGRIAVKNVFTWFAGSRIYYTHKARVAIKQACNLSGLDNDGEILVPSYNCGSEIDPMLKSGCRTILYRINKNALIDIHDLEAKITSRTKAIYVTNFFGFSPDIEDIRKLCDLKRLILIEDCALSLFSSHGSRKLGTFGDIAILNFPKSLPVPDGGALVINNQKIASTPWNLRRPHWIPVLKNLMPLSKAMVLRSLARSTDKSTIIKIFAGNSAAKRAEMDNYTMQKMPSNYFFDETISNTAISNLTHHMLSNFSPQDIIQLRRKNYLTYLEALKNTDRIEPLYRELQPGVCPLAFPVIVPERNRVYAKLTAELIAVAPWWAGYHPDLLWDAYPDARFLKDNILALPVHQQLHTEDILFIADRLLKKC
jgi:dTDP-4-amino-4,6-dideoxygalactose transaminase